MRTTTTITRTGLATLALGLCAAGLPSAASAAGGGERGDRGEQVSSRVTTKLRSVGRGLDRAEGYVEDGDAAKAATALASVRRSLASAQRTTLRKVTADGDGASASATAVERAEHAIVASTTSLYDGQTGDVVTAISTTLDAALDGREALATAVAALTDEQEADYDRYYAKVAKDVAAEAEDVADAVADDELSTEAGTALGEAATRLAAQKTAVDAIVAAADGTTDTTAGAADAAADVVGAAAEACGPGGQRGGRGQGGSDTGSTTDSGMGTTTTTASRFGGGRQ